MDLQNAINGAASSLMGIKHEQNMLTNDLANIKSNGHFPSIVKINAIQDRNTGAEAYTYAIEGGDKINFSQGYLEETGNPYDVAVQSEDGDSFFMIQTPGGVRYTRKGHMQLSATGEAIDDQGNAFLDNGGAAIIIPSNQTITIGGNGIISTSSGVVGKMGVVKFSSLDQMTREGHGYYTTTEAPTPAPKASVLQGSLEMPSTSTVAVMTRLMELSKTYEDNVTLIKNSLDARNDMLKVIGISINA